MTDATLEETATAVAEQEPATQTPAELFRYSTWLHVGPGAEGCEAVDEERGTNDCGDPLHFHGWCRLPNQFQHREIREKALAAKARRTRQLRDSETDAYAILEDDLDALARRGDDARADLIAELVAPEWWKDYFEAVKDVQDLEDEQQPADAEEPVKRFARIEQDEKRLKELEAMPEDKRPADEFEELQRHVLAYHDAIEKRREEIGKPRRQALEELDVNALVDRLREQRIGAASNDEFMHVYSAWEWFVGTRKAPGGERRFESKEAMEASAPEVIEALQDTYRDLSRTQAQGASGNS